MPTCPLDAARLVVVAPASAGRWRCPTCRGLWLSQAAAPGAVGQLTRLTTGRPGALRRCPVDGKPLTAIHVHGVEVDLCPLCEGLWLDHGELQQIRLRREGKQTLSDRLIDGTGNATLEAGARGTWDGIDAVVEWLGEGLSGLL